MPISINKLIAEYKLLTVLKLHILATTCIIMYAKTNTIANTPNLFLFNYNLPLQRLL